MSQVNHLSPVWTHLTDIQPVRAEGAYLYDANGNSFLDFTSGIGVTNTGHCHPRVVQAIQEQAGKLIFGQINVVTVPASAELADALNSVTPANIDSFFFSNSGAEAVEGAVKLARQTTGRRNIIVFQGSFHGRTAQTMAMTTSKYVYRYNYQPLPSGVLTAPFPYCYRYGWDEEETTEWCLRELKLLLKSQTAPEEVAAVVIEPVLGEGGYVPAPAGFLQELRAICNQYGILLILDEIQSGFGRTGKFFSFEHANIMPDILIMAKGLGSGMPISAIGANHALMAQWRPGSHGGTYGGGNALSLVAAKTTIDVIRSEKLVENAAQRGEQLVNGLRQLQKQYPVLGDVRGQGLMIGTEFTDADGEPDAATTARVAEGCLQRDLLILTCGSEGNVVRWIPPLIISAEQIETALGIFAVALAAAIR